PSSSHSVSVSDGLGVRRIDRRRRATSAHPVDDPSEIAVADRLAVFAHGDDGVVDLRQLVAGERQADGLAPLLDDVPARAAAEHELLGVLTNVLRPHDLVGPGILEHSVLVDARFVRKGVAPDDRFVRLDRLVGETREQLARLEELLGLYGRIVWEAIVP